MMNGSMVLADFNYFLYLLSAYSNEKRGFEWGWRKPRSLEELGGE
jgi:hypothetical protein